MELKDTIKMMTSADYKERFKAEYYQLKIRVEKLTAMLNKYKAGELNFTPSCSYETLFEQLICMKHYLSMLEKRAEIEGINLKE